MLVASLLLLAAVARAAESPTIEITIEHVSSGRKYAVAKAEPNSLPYIDRQYALRKLPAALVGQPLVQTSMDDDYVDDAGHLKLNLSGPATVFVALDRRGKSPPDWIKGWDLSKDSLSVDGADYHLYSRRFAAGKLTLGGNDRNKTQASNNYLVILVPEKTRPEFPVAEFAAKVHPLLKAKCFSCHGKDAQEGGLRLDLRRRAFVGGDGGKIIVAGDSEHSDLIARLITNDVTQRMPKDETPLSADEISLVKKWIDGGAVWPDEFAGKEVQSDHWAFRAIKRREVPRPRSASDVRNPIDAFVLEKLEAAQLKFSNEVDKRTLIRRLNLDLIGLPPTPDEVRAFVDDQSPDAYSKLVERLLASNHFGERWAKHWLDLARFAESDGYENDNPRPHVWKYRDWVIDAINADLPFDQFTIQQLAGDLVEQAGPAERIATAFHRNTLHNSAGGADAEEFRSKAVKDRVAVTSSVWLGLTFNCAECHSHKHDPISQREYYEFYAFLNNADHANEGEVPVFQAATRTTQVHKRGSFLDLGDVVEPGTPVFLPELKSRGPRGDRLDLALWLVSPEHPLTARVAVNHVWQHLFGQGLVATPENFGRKGEPPSHPELLDWLAAEFVGLPNADASTEHRLKPWSRKELIRQIVMSSAYRQASMHPEISPAVDPDNRLLWRQNSFRIEAEAVRDLALAASGLFDPTVGGPSIQPLLPKGLAQLSELKNEKFQETSGNPHRRGLYVHMQRTFPYPMFATFDGPDGNQCTMLRDRSTTPLQALTLLNDPAVDECAKALGKKLHAATQDDLGRLHWGCELCLSRPPTEDEQKILLELIAEQRAAKASDEAIWHGVARTLLNLDETITRE